MSSMLLTPAATMASVAFSSMPVEMSTPTTVPRPPTNRAARIATKPVPVAMSNTRSPG